MSDKVIKYVAFFDLVEFSAEQRLYSVAAVNKIKYIVGALVDIGYDVEIVSPSYSLASKGWFSGRVTSVSPGVSLRCFATFGYQNKLMRKLSVAWSLWQLVLYLLMNVSHGEPVLVYHANKLSRAMALIKKLTGCQLILEVEEIYQDVFKMKKADQLFEYRMFALADKYLFSTTALHQQINVHQKPYSVIYGSYQVVPPRAVSFNDGLIHVIYAGKLSLMKGSWQIVEIAQYLDARYRVHIIGFGSQEELTGLKQQLAQPQKPDRAVVTYDGLLEGEAYLTFLQQCHIGLSIQSPEAAFNNSSFPSKIMSYLANGLHVVSVGLPTILDSPLRDHLHLYASSDPQVIANKIMEVDINQAYDSRQLVAELHQDFLIALKALLDS
jgi:hypothetical protein